MHSVIKSFVGSHLPFLRDPGKVSITLPQRDRKQAVLIRDDSATEDRLDEYREMFAIFDKNHDGSIASDEIFNVITSFAIDVSKDEIDSLLAEIDVDGNGEIDFSEFCMVMDKLNQKKISDEEVVLECFKVFDLDKDGVISRDEFLKICIELGELTYKEATNVFRESDIDGNQLLDFSEFRQLVFNYLLTD